MRSRTVLEKCGIPNGIIKKLRREGLFVSRRVRPVKNPIKSPSEEWFYQVADRFTPQFTKQEREYYIKNPDLFCRDLLRGAALLAKTCDLLQNAAASANKMPPEHAIAALLAIQRVFHAALDYSYLKYDRHLEYHDYEESPVGHHWKRFRALSVLASKNARVSNPEEFGYKKILEVLSGYGLTNSSLKNKKIAQKARQFIVKSLKDKRLAQEFSSLVKIFEQFSTTQEKEIKIVGEKLVPTILYYWSFLKVLIRNNPQFTKSEYKNKVNKWLQAEEVPPIITAARELVQVDAKPFTSGVQILYKEELQRWLS